MVVRAHHNFKLSTIVNASIAITRSDQYSSKQRLIAISVILNNIKGDGVDKGEIQILNLNFKLIQSTRKQRCGPVNEQVEVLI